MKNFCTIVLASVAILVASPQFIAAQWTLAIGSAGQQITCFATNGFNMYAGSSNGVLVSTNGGTTWNDYGLSPSHVLSLGAYRDWVYAGTSDKGVFVSTDDGLSWHSRNNGILSQVITAVGIDYFSNVDIGTAGIIYESTDHGMSWSTLHKFSSGSIVYGLVSNGPNLFVWTSKGAFLYNTTNWLSINSGLSDSNIHSLVATGVNDILVGTAKGKIFSSPCNGTSNWTNVSTGVSEDTIQTLVAGTLIFAGTHATGVYFSNKDSWNWASGNTGLDTLNINALTIIRPYFSDAILLAGTPTGIWRRPVSEFGPSDVGISASTERSLTTNPNPTSFRTTIRLSQPKTSDAVITIVNSLGVEVARLFEGKLVAGSHSFYWDCYAYPPGMYYLRVYTTEDGWGIPISLCH